MDYFSVLNLKKEPFSNSPDPEFFFHSREHVDCLQKLELSLLLRRGLNVIIGDVGTGKTTLCRQLIRRFSGRKEVETHLILDPYFLDADEFLATVAKIFIGQKPPPGTNNWQIKERIKQYLFRAGVDQKKTVVLIIDEGQKIPAFCLEILREFLNYETNEYKLLQIVIFAQREFAKTIEKYPNFADRINLYHFLRPLNFHDTRAMIKFRLEQSRGSNKKLKLFTVPAMMAIYRTSGGYPRKIINLCHQSILTMIIQNRNTVGYFLVRSCSRRVFAEQSGGWKKIAGATVAIAAAALVLLAVRAPDRFQKWVPAELFGFSTPFAKKENAAARPPANQSAAVIAPAEIAPLTPAEPALPPAAPPAKAESPTKPPAVQKAQLAAKTPVAGQPQPPAAKQTALKPAPEPAAASYPQSLGKVSLRRDETLSRIIQRVYGKFTSRYFRSFILANPDIKDPDRVEVGQSIFLPAIAVPVKPPDAGAWWIQLAEKKSLAAALDFLRTYPPNAPAVRLIPYWKPDKGTRFALVLKKYFSDRAAARRKLQRLAASTAAAGDIVSLWSRDAVYFANPFMGGKSRAGS